MKTLREVLDDSERRRIGIGHFNVSDLVTLKAVTEAARSLNAPVLVGVSESEREFIGVRQIAALVRSIREEYDLPVFLNADHTHSLANAIEAAKAGFDAVVYDRSSLPFEENLAETRRALEAVKAINPNILVEGEIGDIGAGSEIHELAAPVFTTPAEASRFVAETGVDVLAPAVGNMHGLSSKMARGESHKRLNISRISEIKAATQTFLTLHGASGTWDDDLKNAIAAGINIVHINTELRLAWRKGIQAGLADRPNEVAAYKILPPAVEAVKNVVRSRLSLFQSALSNTA